MQLIKTYFRTLVKSSTSAPYYQDIVKAPFSFSLKFFFMSLIFYSLGASLYLSVTFLLPIKGMFDLLPEKLANVFPSELEIKIQKGQVSTNVEEPYFLPLEKVTGFFDELQNQIRGVTTARPTYFLVIDTHAATDDFFGLQTFILMTKKHLVFYNDTGNAEIVPLNDLDGITLNQASIASILQKLLPFFKLVWPALVILLFLILVLILPLAYFSYAVCLSVLGFVTARLLKLPLKFSQVLQIFLHLMVPIIFFTGLIHLVGLSLAVPYLNIILYLVVSLIIMLHLKESDLAQTHPASKK